MKKPCFLTKETVRKQNQILSGSRGMMKKIKPKTGCS